jgi:hypothetical protein
MSARTKLDLHEVSGWHRAALAAVALVVALIAAGAFTLSFDALRELAVLAGVRYDIAFLWPLIVDGFIFTATVAAVLLRPRGLRVSWYPWATLIVFAAISVAGNALHAADNHTALDLTIAAAVSAVPAVALLLASHLLVTVLEGFRWTAQGPDPAVASAAAPSSGRHTAERSLQATTRQVPARLNGAAHASHGQTSSERRATVDGKVLAWIETERAARRPITGARLADHLGVSPATGRRKLAAARASNPHPEASR